MDRYKQHRLRHRVSETTYERWTRPARTYERERLRDRVSADRGRPPGTILWRLSVVYRWRTWILRRARRVIARGAPPDRSLDLQSRTGWPQQQGHAIQLRPHPGAAPPAAGTPR